MGAEIDDRAPPGFMRNGGAAICLVKNPMDRKMDDGKETHSDAEPELKRLRDSIDNIDAALVHLLAERFKFTKFVGEFKARHGLPVADPAREAAQIARLRGLAKAAKLDPDFAEKFLTFIVQEVIRHHEALKRR